MHMSKCLDVHLWLLGMPVHIISACSQASCMELMCFPHQDSKTDRVGETKGSCYNASPPISAQSKVL